MEERYEGEVVTGIARGFYFHSLDEESRPGHLKERQVAKGWSEFCETNGLRLDLTPSH